MRRKVDGVGADGGHRRRPDAAADRAEAGNALAGTFGGALKEIFWTLGPYDIVVVSEAPDDESATAFALTLASQGNVRTTTMRAFGADEMKAIIAKAP